MQVKAEFVNVDGVLTEDLNMLMPEIWRWLQEDLNLLMPVQLFPSAAQDSAAGVKRRSC